MLPVTSIRARLLTFTTASILIVAGVATAGVLMVRRTHADDVRVTVEISRSLRRSTDVLDRLVGTQICLQNLLRIKDADEIEAGMKQYETSRQRASDLIDGVGPSVQAPFAKMTSAGKTVLEEILTANNADALQKFVAAYIPAMEETVAAVRLQAGAVEQTADRSIAEKNAATNRVLSLAALAVTIALIALAVGSWRFQRAITRPLLHMADRLRSAATTLGDLSAAVTRSSQTVADGSSAQAAALQQTSASLEEVSSMTKRNAENSGRAKIIAAQTRAAADTGAGDMTSLDEAMADIKTASANIGKIIKTIDEIAFQTNILALNAAVEAARSGEAGLGFAVVADEVRSLAHRSAQAARETAEKIEDSIRKSERGAEISTRVGLSLTAIVSRAREVDQFVAEIATASAEQNQGLSQLLTGVTQMDKATQMNAASAEESAAATNEVNREVAVLNESVAELRAMLGLQVTDVQVPAEDLSEALPAAS